MQKDPIGLTNLPKDIQMLYMAACVQRQQGYQVFQYQRDKENHTKLSDIAFFLMNLRSPAIELPESEIQELQKWDGNYYSMCLQKGRDYVLKYVYDEQMDFHNCRSQCREQYDPKKRLLDFAQRSTCFRECENNLDRVVKKRVNDGTFPGVKELVP